MIYLACTVGPTAEEMAAYADEHGLETIDIAEMNALLGKQVAAIRIPEEIDILNRISNRLADISNKLGSR